MLRQPWFWLIFLVLAACGAVVLLGDADDSVNMSAASEVWGDVLRDVDQFGLSLTRVSDVDEVTLGEKLASELTTADGPDDRRTAYVTAVGRLLEPHLRRRHIPYTYHVVDWPEANAMALPGGQILITTGMLELIETEAELAAVLGHEMAHIDLRHCIERFQAAVHLQKLDLGTIGNLIDLLPALARQGYRKYQEAEADAAGQRVTIAAGYDPRAAVEILRRAAARQPEDLERGRTAARNPVTEVLAAAGEAVGGYAASHPDPSERIARLEHQELRRRFWAGRRSFVIGRENYRRGITVAAETFEGETTDAR